MDLSALIFAALKSAKTANERIDNLPLPMVFKGTLGTGGTISTLPTASSSNEGFVYIVITDGTYAGQTAKAGDTFVSDGSSWVLVPSADEPSVIDDNVTSTALTWSSKKINDECKVKSFTYTGNGQTTNTITFPVKPKVVIDIQVNASLTTALISQIWWLKTIGGLMTIVGDTSGSTACYGFSITFNDEDNEMILTSSASAGRVFNNDGQTYTVYYI